MSIGELELKRFLDNTGARMTMTNGVSSLLSSGIFNLLRQFARPFARDGGRDIAAQAHQASYCEGYNAALDDLLYFEEKYFKPTMGNHKVKADFGGLKFALANGDLSKADLERMKK